MKISYLKYILPPLLLGSAFCINKELLKPKSLKLTKQDEAINISGTFLKYATSSYRLLTTDLLWITTLLESDLEHYKSKDLNSWMYLRFKSIVELDPNFLMAYQYGGQYLNIIKDDLEGSSKILEKGLKQFPNNYELISSAAFLYTFELKNTERAIELYNIAIKFPQAPDFFHSILTKLKLQKNQNPKEAFLYLHSYYQQLSTGIFKEKLEKDLYALKAQIDLECLNSSSNKYCDFYDFNGDKYIVKNGVFNSKKNFEPYRLYDKSEKEE